MVKYDCKLGYHVGFAERNDSTVGTRCQFAAPQVRRICYNLLVLRLKKITIRELVKDYVDDPERGVSGYGGRLDIRPEYQREFVYKEKDRDAVIRTVMRGFPLNVMYWAKKNDGSFEVMDGQQRTISICQYVAGDFAWGDLELGKKYFHRQPQDIQDKFLDYELMV